jgi:hypothetical protein
MGGIYKYFFVWEYDYRGLYFFDLSQIFVFLNKILYMKFEQKRIFFYNLLKFYRQ